MTCLLLKIALSAIWLNSFAPSLYSFGSVELTAVFVDMTSLFKSPTGTALIWISVELMISFNLCCLFIGTNYDSTGKGVRSSACLPACLRMNSFFGTFSFCKDTAENAPSEVCHGSR